MPRYAQEMIGTFFLVLTIGCAVIAGAPGVIAPLAIGSILMVMIYAGGQISGAHYNPAVTPGACAAAAMADVIPRMAARVIGGGLPLPRCCSQNRSCCRGRSRRSDSGGASAEFLHLALVYVVLNTATATATKGNSYFGLAIGFTVLVGAFAVGDISGGAFNPAVAVGAIVMGLLPASTIWVYLVGELLGGAVAALLFKGLNPNDR